MYSNFLLDFHRNQKLQLVLRYWEIVLEEEERQLKEQVGKESFAIVDQICSEFYFVI